VLLSLGKSDERMDMYFGTSATDMVHGLASELAVGAGTFFVRQRVTIADASMRGTVGDREAHEYLDIEFTRPVPGDAILSEEDTAKPGRIGLSRVWIVDPLDDAREYGEPPTDDRAVRVVLAVNGPSIAGAVALTVRGRTLRTDTNPPAPQPVPLRPRILARWTP
jgi:3'(2'), 5'-bisphosphate nucleotidase